MTSSTRLRRLRCVVATLALALAFGCAPRRQSTIPLLDRFPDSPAVLPGHELVSTNEIELDFDRRHALVLPMPSRIRFDSVPVQLGARLLLASALERSPSATAGARRAARLEIACTSGTGKGLWRTTIPVSADATGSRPAWRERAVKLDGCSRSTTSIELAASCESSEGCGTGSILVGEPRIAYRDRRTPKPRRLFLMISIDTLRPSRVGLFGGSRHNSPNLDRLATDSVVFPSAFAPSPWTIPSHASLFSAVDPLVHGMDQRRTLPVDLALVQEAFRAAGWQTAGFVDTSFLSAERGFGRGFDHYDDEPPAGGEARRGGERTLARLLSWLSEADERPAFVFWHFFDVHGPYGAPAPWGGSFRRALRAPRNDPRLARLASFAYHDYLLLDRFTSFDELVAGYDESVRHADAVVGTLVAELRRTGLYDEAAIVLTSDHGESLLDHDLWVGHGLFLTDDELRVPLVLKLPGNRFAGEREEGLVRLVDLAPTLLELASLPIPSSFQGASIARALGPEGDKRLFPIFLLGASSNTGAICVRTANAKYIAPARASAETILAEHLLAADRARLAQISELLAEQFYDLRSDPGESRNLAPTALELPTFRRLAIELAAQSAARRGRQRPGDEIAPDEDEAARLRSLGYLR